MGTLIFSFLNPPMPTGVAYEDPPIFLWPESGQVTLRAVAQTFQPSSTAPGPIADLSPATLARFMLDGQPLEDWKPMEPCTAPRPSAVKAERSLAINIDGLALGQHWLAVEWQGTGVYTWCEAIPVYVGPPLAGAQTLRHGPVKFDVVYNPPGGGPKTGLAVHYPGEEPNRPGFPYPSRTPVPWTTTLASSSLWAQRMTTSAGHGSNGYPRRFGKTGDGRIVIKNNPLPYYYLFSGLSHPFSGGPRNVACLALVTHLNVAANGVCFGLSGEGVVWRCKPDGDVDILAGWRPAGQTDRSRDLPPGTEPEPWQIGSTQPAPGASYREFFGEWIDGGSQARRPFEPWGMHRDVADDLNPDTIELGGEHKWFKCDTRAGRLVGLNHHEVHHGGRPTFEVLIGDRDGILNASGVWQGELAYRMGVGTDARLIAPWKITYSPLTDLYYFTEYGGHAICWYNAHTNEVGELVRSALLPPRPFAVIANDSFYGNEVAAGMSPWDYHADGPPGVARLLHPQGLDIDSTGRYLIFGQRPRFVPAVRRVDVLTGEVVTLAWAPTSSTARDMDISVNKDGTVGILDDILVTTWSSNKRYSKDGADRGALFVPDGTGGAGRVLCGPVPQSTVAVGGLGPIASGGGAIWCVSGGREGLYRVTQRQAGDAVYKLNPHYNGKQHFSNHIGMRYGFRGQGQMGEGDIDTLRASYDDAALLARLKADNPSVANLTAAQQQELLYYLSWEAMAGSVARGYNWASGGAPPPPPPTGDTQPPTGTWVAPTPASQATVRGAITLAVEARDNVGLRSVSLYRATGNLGSVPLSGMVATATWHVDTVLIPTGWQKFDVWGVDVNGRGAWIASRTFMVAR